MLERMKAGGADATDGKDDISTVIKSMLVFIVLFMFFLITPPALDGLTGGGGTGYTCGGDGANASGGWISTVLSDGTQIWYKESNNTPGYQVGETAVITDPTSNGNNANNANGKCFINLSKQVGTGGADLSGLTGLINQVLDYIFLGGLIASIVALAIKMFLLRVNP